MITDMKNIVRLNKSQIKPATDVLVKAFQDYPLYVYFFPRTSERVNNLSHLIRILVHYGVLYGEVYATSANLEAVSVWLPSDKVDLSAWRLVKSGLFSSVFKIRPSSGGRMFRFAKYSTNVHKRHTPPQHWYFQLLGVDPVFQGKGYAGALIKPVLARMDKEHFSCYLETHEQENVPIFQRYGFTVVEEGTIPNSEITQWAMLR